MQRPNSLIHSHAEPICALRKTDVNEAARPVDVQADLACPDPSQLASQPLSPVRPIVDGCTRYRMLSSSVGLIRYRHLSHSLFEIGGVPP